jgi:cytochrome c6
VALAATIAVVTAGCGGAAPGGSNSIRAVASTSPTKLTEDQRGAQIFASQGCGGCHTLAAAHSSASIGPDLNDLKPSYTAVVHQVENGGGPMPSFRNELSPAQISAVAHYVSSSTH